MKHRHWHTLAAAATVQAEVRATAPANRNTEKYNSPGLFTPSELSWSFMAAVRLQLFVAQRECVIQAYYWVTAEAQQPWLTGHWKLEMDVSISP